MNNFRYKLVGIRQIQKIPIMEEINKSDIIVKPLYLSICRADQRYYFGNREPEILNKKLPLCLIHEGIGIVTKSLSKKFKKGDKVILLPTKVNNKSINENYDLNSKFMSSNIDGFMQENVILSSKNLILIDKHFKDYETMVLSELMSCAIHAVESNLKTLNECKSIAIFGDGSLAYLLHLYLINKFKNKALFVFGVNDDKLSIFSKNAQTINVINDNSNKNINYDVAFEVVGGDSTEKIINNIINNINPVGTLILMGVSENKISINTRMILEKGITLIGRSRSTYNDFVLARNFIYKNYKEIKKIINRIIEINNIDDIHFAFENSLSSPFKTIMKWKI